MPKDRQTSLADKKRLQKTQIIQMLLSQSPDKRNEYWQKQFFGNLPEAYLALRQPDVLQGPDGFPYLQMTIPNPYQAFESYTLESAIEKYTLREGLGAVIYLTEDALEPEWVFSYGDLLNYSLNGDFYRESPEIQFRKFTPDSALGAVNSLSDKVKTEQFPAGMQWVEGPPAEKIFPAVARAALKAFLETHGMTMPKYALIQYLHEGKLVADLVLNVLPQNFANQQVYEYIMNSIGWFLPRYYSFCTMDDKDGSTSFSPL